MREYFAIFNGDKQIGEFSSFSAAYENAKSTKGIVFDSVKVCHIIETETQTKYTQIFPMLPKSQFIVIVPDNIASRGYYCYELARDMLRNCRDGSKIVFSNFVSNYERNNILLTYKYGRGLFD